MVKATSCFNTCDGEAEVLWVDFGSAPYQYVWSNGEIGPKATTLCKGKHYVTVYDASGAHITDSVTVSGPDRLMAELRTTPVSGVDMNDGTAAAIVSGGTPPYTFEWFDTALTDSLLTGLSGGQYALAVTDANGCDTVVQGQVGAGPAATCLEANSILTPNGDGENDTFILQCATSGTFEWVELAVFNRFGQEVFSSLRYDNTWQATDRRNQILPTGSYYYVAKGFGNPATITEKTGYINILSD